jgi:hypothetical protein
MLAIALARLLASLLYGVSSVHPPSLAFAAVLVDFRGSVGVISTGAPGERGRFRHRAAAGLTHRKLRGSLTL